MNGVLDQEMQESGIVKEVSPLSYSIEGHQYHLPGLSKEVVQLFLRDETKLHVTVHTTQNELPVKYVVGFSLNIRQVQYLFHEYYEKCADEDVEHLFEEAERYNKQYLDELPDRILHEWVTSMSKWIPVPSQKVGNKLIRTYYAHLIHHNFPNVELVVRGAHDLYQVMDKRWAKADRGIRVDEMQ